MPSSGAASSEQPLLRSLIDNISDVVYLKDLQHRFIEANNAAARLFGEDSSAALVGKTDFDYFPKKVAAAYHADERQLLETGKALAAKEVNGIDSQGIPFTCQITKTPIRDETGALIGLAGIGRDLTVVQQQKRLIELEREQLRTLIDNIPDPIYFKDSESRYINGNAGFYRGFNAASMEEIIGKSDFDFFPKEVAQRFRDDETALYESRQGYTKEEVSYDQNGRALHFQTTKTPIFSPDSKEVIGMVGISRDISETKQAQSQLVQSEKMASLGVLTAGIAHEINNPINFVYAGVNSMSKDFEDVKAVVSQLQQLSQSPDPASAIDALQRIRDEVGFDEAFAALEETLSHIKLGASRITKIVAGLSKFSRLGKEDWQPAHLHEDIENVLLILKNKYKAHVKIERDFTPRLPAIVCFPSKLNQAFMNLIGNAIDAINARGAPKGGTIQISTRATPDTVSITIKDDGIGMSKAVSEKVFDPFFTTKSVGKGTGLGLSITYSIIQDHRGSLQVESSPGKGSAFTITLPIEQERHRPPLNASRTQQ